MTTTSKTQKKTTDTPKEEKVICSYVGAGLFTLIKKVTQNGDT